VVEQVAGMSLDRFCHERIYRPLGLRATGFIDSSTARTRKFEPVPEMFAATENCPSRKRILIGEVDDENAFAMGGVAGHAGLFAPAREIDRIAAELIAIYHGRSNFVPEEIVREFWTRDGAVPGSTWALGWDMPSPIHSSSGHHFPPTAIGHLGFTGTSLWIDPDRQIAILVLTNRVHPSRENQAIREFRPKIHDLIMEAIDGA
jgi:serine-type D-Ala-D-Ala carboxypeptidase